MSVYRKFMWALFGTSILAFVSALLLRIVELGAHKLPPGERPPSGSEVSTLLDLSFVLMGLSLALFGLFGLRAWIRSRAERRRQRAARLIKPERLLGQAKRLSADGEGQTHFGTMRMAEFVSEAGVIQIGYPSFSTRLKRRVRWLIPKFVSGESSPWRWMYLAGLEASVDIIRFPIIGEDGSSSVITDHFIIGEHSSAYLFYSSSVETFTPEGEWDDENFFSAILETREEREEDLHLALQLGLFHATPEQIREVIDLLETLGSTQRLIQLPDTQGPLDESLNNPIRRLLVRYHVWAIGRHRRDLADPGFDLPAEEA